MWHISVLCSCYWEHFRNEENTKKKSKSKFLLQDSIADTWMCLFLTSWVILWTCMCPFAFVCLCAIENMADVVLHPVCGTWLYSKVVSHWAMMAHAFNPSTLKTEAGGSLWVLGQPGIHSETLSQNNKKLLGNSSFRGRKITKKSWPLLSGPLTSFSGTFWRT